MTDPTDALKRVLDFLDGWPTRFGPTISIIHEDDGPVELNVSDLYVLADALKGQTFADRMAAKSMAAAPDVVVCEAPALPEEPKDDEQYAILTPVRTPSGLTAGEDTTPITTQQGRKFLTGEILLGFHEALLWRASDARPWEVVMSGHGRA